MILDLKASTGKYEILISKNLIKDIQEHIQEFNFKKICIIIDENIDRLYGNLLESGFSENIRIFKKVILSGEKYKNISTLMDIYSFLAVKSFNRADGIISIGGGVVGDISGFVASTYLRGIKYIQIPTTLLSQVDSSVGGKTGIDISQGKNLVGTFYHPSKVIIDVELLSSLEDRVFNDGMAEVIKYALINSKELFSILKENSYHDIRFNKNGILEDIIFRCCSIKKEVVESDEFDKGNRMILNFGHTLGHAIESFYSYSKYSHGEAVSIGMYRVCEILKNSDQIRGEVLDDIKLLLEKFMLPKYDENIKNPDLLKYIENDKKNEGNHLNIITIKGIGEWEIIKGSIDFFKD